MEERLHYIDSVRGLAILLMVLGHMVQLNTTEEWLFNPIFRVIYSFHMPLFFILSGMTCGIKKYSLSIIDGILKPVKHKFIALIIPALSWTYIVPYFFHDFFISPLNKEFKLPWFLWKLFAVYVVFFIMHYLYKKNSFLRYISLFVLTGIILFTCITEKGCVSSLYFVSFMIGYLLGKYNVVNKAFAKHFKMFSYASGFSLLLFCLLSGYFVYGYDENGLQSRIYFELFLTILATICLFFYFYQVDKGFIINMLKYFGTYSIGIYVCHNYFRNLNCGVYVNDYPMLVQLVIFVVLSISICFVCSIIQSFFEKFPITSTLMYGRKYKRW